MRDSKRYAINTAEITKKRPSRDESIQKYKRYKLKAELGLMELYDEKSMKYDEIIKKAGFRDEKDYNSARIEAIQLIDRNMPIPKDLEIKLKKVQKMMTE